ncbi:uncharacterized protein LOC143017560 [Oratosquilla oratoria]|uniref:uncharacterized protein LOC143017560 n=1 Tax=Oratosquilla oratoria TaxID=337810 RepID=UPI003F75B5A3
MAEAIQSTSEKKGDYTEDKDSPPCSAGPRERLRLLVVSQRARNLGPITSSLGDDVVCVTYKYETSTLDDILHLVHEKLEGRKVVSVAFILHGSETELRLCGPGEKVVSSHTVSEQMSVREFFSNLTNQHIYRRLPHTRLDFLAAHPAHSDEGALIAGTLSSLLDSERYKIARMQRAVTKVVPSL